MKEREESYYKLEERVIELRDALVKARRVLGNVSELYDPKYLLYSDSLFKELDKVIEGNP